MNRKYWLRAALLALLLIVNGCAMTGDRTSRPAPMQDGGKGDGGGGY